VKLPNIKFNGSFYNGCGDLLQAGRWMEEETKLIWAFSQVFVATEPMRISIVVPALLYNVTLVGGVQQDAMIQYY
jgi:hypothetical protein